MKMKRDAGFERVAEKVNIIMDLRGKGWTIVY
jgi:hypothetical protein